MARAAHPATRGHSVGRTNPDSPPPYRAFLRTGRLRWTSTSEATAPTRSMAPSESSSRARLRPWRDNRAFGRDQFAHRRQLPAGPQGLGGSDRQVMVIPLQRWPDARRSGHDRRRIEAPPRGATGSVPKRPGRCECVFARASRGRGTRSPSRSPRGSRNCRRSRAPTQCTVAFPAVLVWPTVSSRS